MLSIRELTMSILFSLGTGSVANIGLGYIFVSLGVCYLMLRGEFANRGDISRARQITAVGTSVCLTSASLSPRVLITRKYARPSADFLPLLREGLLTGRPVIFECNCYATRSASEREVSCVYPTFGLRMKLSLSLGTERRAARLRISG